MERPFKFLDSYARADAALFHGRDREVEELFSKIFEGKLLLVYGVSGSGKSSLVNCGLAARFEATDRLPVNVRRRSNLNDDLLDAVIAQAATPIEGRPGLRKALRSVYLDHFMPVHLVLDQFEELFIFGTDEEQQSFFAGLAKVLASDLNVKVVIIIREEFLAHLTPFESFLPDLFENRARLERMTWKNAVQAIEGPCKTVGISLEEGFPEQLLNNIAVGRKEVELTYLQVYLDRVFNLTQDAGDTAFRLEHLRAIGPIGDVLGHFLDEQVGSFPDPKHALTVLKAFVSSRGTKKQVSPAEALGFARELGQDLTAEAVNDILFRAVNLRLLKEQDEQGRHELRHDALASTLFSKISGYEKDLLEIKQFMEQAWASHERRGVLLSETDLKYIAPFEDRLLLNKEQRGLVDRSRKELGRKARARLAIIGTVATVVLIALSALTIRAFQEKSKADAALVEADRERGIAMQARDDAENAQRDAERRQQVADSLRKETVRNAEELAKAYEEGNIQRIRAALGEQEALKQAAIAESQKQLAEDKTKETKTALDSLQRTSKQLTESERRERATRLAQSSLNTADPTLKGLLATQAMVLDKQAGGNQDGDELVLALRRAQLALETRGAKPPYVGMTAAPRALATAGGALLALGNDAVLTKLDMKAMLKTTVTDLSTKKAGLDVWTLSEDAGWMIVARREGQVQAWSSSTGELVAAASAGAHSAEIAWVIGSSTTGRIATADRTGRIVLWQREGQRLRNTRTHEAGASVKHLLLLSGSGSLVAATGSDRLLLISPDGEMRMLALRSGDKAVRIHAASTNKQVVVGTESGALLNVDLALGRVQTIMEASKRIDLIAVDEASGRIAVVDASSMLWIISGDGKERIRYPLAEKPISMIFGTGEEVYLGFSSKVERVYATSAAMKRRICQMVNRDFTADEWRRHVDANSAPEKTCTAP